MSTVPPSRQPIWLEGDDVLWTNDLGSVSSVSIVSVREVAVEPGLDRPPTLVLFGRKGRVDRFALDRPGVDVLLARLGTLPGFDAEAFGRASAGAERSRVSVLRRAPAINARLCSEPATRLGEQRALEQDLALGPRHLAARERISWSISLDEAASRFLTPPDPARPSQHGFGAVMLGPLTIDELFATTQSRSDVPFACWEAQVVLLRDGWQANEALLVDHFRDLLGAPDEPAPWHRTGEASSGWTRDGITLAVLYQGPTTSKPEDGYCTVRIMNMRNYPNFLTDPYCDFVRTVDVVAESYEVPGVTCKGDWRTSQDLRRTPAGLVDLLPGENHLLAWRDRDGSHIGFADRDYASIYPRQLIEKLVLQRATSDRGPSTSSLSFKAYGQERRMGGPTARYASFDLLLGELGSLLNVPVETVADYEG